MGRQVSKLPDNLETVTEDHLKDGWGQRDDAGAWEAMHVQSNGLRWFGHGPTEGLSWTNLHLAVVARIRRWRSTRVPIF